MRHPDSTAEVHTLLDSDMANRAIAALTDADDTTTFSRAQVAYLMALAFQVGAEATLADRADDPAIVNLAYQSGYTDGVEDGYDGALAEVWEAIRFGFSGPRRKTRDGVRGNLTAADAVWWHQLAVDQRNARRKADQEVPEPPPTVVPEQPARHLEAVAA